MGGQSFHDGYRQGTGATRRSATVLPRVLVRAVRRQDDSSNSPARDGAAFWFVATGWQPTGPTSVPRIASTKTGGASHHLLRRRRSLANRRKTGVMFSSDISLRLDARSTPTAP